MSNRTGTALVVAALASLGWSSSVGCGGKSRSDEKSSAAPSSAGETSGGGGAGGRPGSGSGSGGGVTDDCFPSACCSYNSAFCCLECPTTQVGPAGQGGEAGQVATESGPCEDENGNGLADLTMRLRVSCGALAAIEVDLCNRGLVEAPASLHLSVYAGETLLCAGNPESAVMPGHCVQGPCAFDAPLEPGVPLTAAVNDGEPALPECVVSNNAASDEGCE